MRIKKGFELRRVGDENIVVAKGAQNVDFSRIISLNETAAQLWKAVEGKTFRADDLAAFLLEEYCVDADTARRDADLLAEAWLKAGITEP